MLNAGIDNFFRDVILGHSLVGMDAFHMAPSEEDLIDVMRKCTEWFDKKIELALVDQAVN